MKTTRHYAVNVLFANLGTLALGHLDEKTLESAMTNFEALRKVADDFEALKKELFKRIYGDIEQMADDDKQRINDFFSMLEKAKNDTEAVKAAYSDLYALREKEVKVIISLLNKEIEIDIDPMDEKAFTKGVLLGNKNAKANDIAMVFRPMFKAENEETNTDFSELDELV